MSGSRNISSAEGQGHPLLVFSTGGLVGLQTLRAFVATQLGYKVLWNIRIKEPRNTGFPDRVISYFFSLCEGQHSSLQWTETFLSHFFRGVPSYIKLLHLIVDYGGPLSKTVILVPSFPLVGDCGIFCKN